MSREQFNRQLLLLAIITAGNLLVLFIRDIIIDNNIYQFLLWNLFLGFVPLATSWIVLALYQKVNKYIIYALAFLWLLFYPNAPYMISDLIHVDKADPRVLYDALIIFSISMLSVFYGFYSIKIIKLVATKMIGTKTAATLMTASILLSSFGIYLGRILRLNSWDLFTHPMVVLKQIIDCLWPVTKNPATYVVIILFSAIQFMLLYMMKDMDDVDDSVPQNA